MEWRAVKVTGKYDLSNQVALRNQYNANQYGYHLLTPLQFDGKAVLVDRGWIPAEGNAMSTLVLSHGSPLRLNWPRIGALSGTFSLHLLAIGLLLIPATAAMQLMKPQSDVITAHWVEPKPPPTAEPVPPKPPPLVRHEVL